MHSVSGLVSPIKRVFVVGAYVPHGGTHMAYHLGRILRQDFNLPVTAVAVGSETAHGGLFRYDPAFPTISVDTMEKTIGPDDLLICNPSFSNRCFGLRLACRKLMYVQGFNTFKILDGFFDHYVTVSDFVRDFVRRTYGLDSHVIPPFIDVPSPLRPWADRPEHSITVHLKGEDSEQSLLLARLGDLIQSRAPELARALDWEGSVLSINGDRDHDDFLTTMGRARYLVVLSVAEGFGLVPLEAMAQGVVVAGLDGFGGRHYMRPGQNCATAPYPDLEAAADRLIATMRSPHIGQALSDTALRTAAEYGYERFRRAWIAEFSRAFSLVPSHNAAHPSSRPSGWGAENRSAAGGAAECAIASNSA